MDVDRADEVGRCVSGRVDLVSISVRLGVLGMLVDWEGVGGKCGDILQEWNSLSASGLDFFLLGSCQTASCRRAAG